MNSKPPEEEAQKKRGKPVPSVTSTLEQPHPAFGANLRTRIARLSAVLAEVRSVFRWDATGNTHDSLLRHFLPAISAVHDHTPANMYTE